jgi:DHA2 family multidrug resistance protein
MSTEQETLEEAWAPRFNPWLIGVTVSLAAFMEVLDSSIANVALPHIAGGLGASNDESTWVLTSYLVSNAIVLPLSGFLVAMLGRKRFFMACILLFTLSSFLCGTATSLGLLLLFRVLQGAFGGGLQPMAQSILADSFPQQKRGLAFALYGVTAVCAPAIGPTLGGWLTDNYSWRWIFYVNVPVGGLAFLLVQLLVDDPPYLKKLKRAAGRFDYVGFSLLAIGVGALQVALDKGQEDDWFGSTFITLLIVTAAVGLIALIIWEWTQEHPVVDVRLFRKFNFATSSVMFFIVGIILFSGTVLMPQFLQTLMGYTAEDAGLVLSVAALVLLFMLGFVGRLTTIFQARHLIALGWAGLAIGMYVSCRWVDLQVSFQSAEWVRTLQYWSIGFLFVPLTLAAYVGLTPAETNSASGLMNFMRNIGQSVGTSAVTTLLARRSQYHQAVLADFTSAGRLEGTIQAVTARLSRSGLSSYDAERQAIGRAYAAVQAQAATLAYVDVYWLLAMFSAAMLLCSFLLKANKPGRSGPVSMH